VEFYAPIEANRYKLEIGTPKRSIFRKINEKTSERG
jgi:hypothetical protein